MIFQEVYICLNEANKIDELINQSINQSNQINQSINSIAHT